VVLPLAVITGVVGFAFTVTAVGAELAEQLLALITVTEYDPAAVALILCVVAPVLQEYEVATGEESVTLPPWQNVVLPLVVITGVAGFELTVTVVGPELAEQLLALLTVTEYDPADVGLMLCVVAPVLQE
jgi:hypothetical protein